MVKISIHYDGDLRCTATHGPSGTRLITDPPVDNMGKGESFSPTDLVATALGTCIMSIMGMAARRMEIDLRGTTVEVTKEMVTDPVRRIGRLAVTIQVPAAVAKTFSDEQKQKLENTAHTCPVCRSLGDNVERPVKIHWG
jgi:putative redox protein